MIAIQVLFYYHTGHCDNLEKAGVGTPFHNYKKKSINLRCTHFVSILSLWSSMKWNLLDPLFV